MKDKLSLITFNTPRLFIVFFILTIPFDYNLLPSTGSWFLPVTEALTEWSSSSIFGLSSKHYSQIISDSSGMYIHVLHLIILSFIIALFLPKRLLLIDRAIPYYLSLMLLFYGLNKVFLYQFYFPEPNTLHTPLGQLSKDIVYWSSMGTSGSYQLFMGLLEVIPALLLLFRKTRVLGALISLGVLINVFFVNIGFDISVKILSLFLIFVNVILLSPFLKSLIEFFSGRKSQLVTTPQPHTFQKYLALLAVILVLTETLFPYAKIGFVSAKDLNKDQLVGSYNVLNSTGINRIHFHSDQFMILETHDQQFKSHQFTKKQTQLVFSPQKAFAYSLSGDQMTLDMDTTILDLEKINVKRLPIVKDDFSWTIQGSLGRIK